MVGGVKGGDKWEALVGRVDIARIRHGRWDWEILTWSKSSLQDTAPTVA